MFTRRLRIIRQLKRATLKQCAPTELRAELGHGGIFCQPFFKGLLRQHRINFHCTLPGH